MGEWASEYLSRFESSAFYSHTSAIALWNLFLAIGLYLTETIIKIRQSRQLAMAELAEATSLKRSPGYVAPLFFHILANADLTPLPPEGLDALRAFALQEVIPHSAKVSNSLSIKRKLKPFIPPVVVQQWYPLLSIYFLLLLSYFLFNLALLWQQLSS